MEAAERQKLFLSGEVARILREDPRTVRRWAMLFADYLTCSNGNQQRRLFSEQDVRFLRRIHWMLREEGMTSDQALILLAEEREVGIHVELPDNDELLLAAETGDGCTANSIQTGDTDGAQQIEVAHGETRTDVEADEHGSESDPIKANREAHGDTLSHRQRRLPLRTSLLKSWKQKISELQYELHHLKNAHADLLTQWEALNVQYAQLQQQLAWHSSQNAPKESGIMTELHEGEADGHVSRQHEEMAITVPLGPRLRTRRSRRAHHVLLSWLVGLIG